MNKDQTNPIQIKAESMQRRLSIFQKYGIIRLNDLFHKQLSSAFKEFKTKKNLIQTPQFSIEVVRPKLKGDLIIQESFDVSNLKIKRSERIKKFDFESYHYENINLIDASDKTKENYTKIQNIHQLLQLQSFQRQKLTTPQIIIKSERRINHLYLLSLIIVLVLLCIGC